VSTDDPRDPGIDAAYGKTARDEPPRALDERILAAAHRAVAARPASIGRSFAQRWRVPVALAATVVLSATVTLMVYESDRAPPVPEELWSDKTRSDKARSNEAQSDQASPEKARQEDRVAPFPAELPRPAAAPPAPAESRAPIAPRAKDAEQPLAKKRAAPGTPQSEGSVGTMRERALADRPVDRAERDSGTGVAESALRTPEDWVAEIRRVKQAGRVDEANRLVTELRARFPDYVLPEDLR